MPPHVTDWQLRLNIPLKVISAKRVKGWPGDGIALIIPHYLGTGETRGMPWQSGTIKRHFPTPEEVKKKAASVQHTQEEEESQITIKERTALLPPDLDGQLGFIIITSDGPSSEKNTNFTSNEVIYQIAEDNRVHVVGWIPRTDPLYFPMTRPWIKEGCLPFYIRNVIYAGKRPGRRSLTLAVLSDEDAGHFERFYFDRGKKIDRAYTSGQVRNRVTGKVSIISPSDWIQSAFNREQTGEISCRTRRPRKKEISDVLVNLGLLEEWQRKAALKEFNGNPANRDLWRKYNANTVTVGYKVILAAYTKMLSRLDPVVLGIDQDADPILYGQLMEKRNELFDDWDHLLFKRFIRRGPKDSARPRIGANAAEERIVAQRQLQKLLELDANGNLNIKEDARWELGLETSTFNPEDLMLSMQVGRKTVVGIVAQWLHFLYGDQIKLMQEGFVQREAENAREIEAERAERKAERGFLFDEEDDDDDDEGDD
jgi:hypothetical protein